MQTLFDQEHFSKGPSDKDTVLLSTPDQRVEFKRRGDKVVAVVKAPVDLAVEYPVQPITFRGPAKAVLMDLDGTTVLSEELWVQALATTVGILLEDPNFSFKPEDLPFVSGYSTREHLQYCLEKYNIETVITKAVAIHSQVSEDLLARLEKEALLSPAPGLEEFLLTLKENNVKITLVTSASEAKALTEIKSAFKHLDLGDPLKFYDAIITSGKTCAKHMPGTLSSLSAKPHPWLYLEAARMGLGLQVEEQERIIGIEDSAAGVISLRLAGYAALGIKGGNIAASGMSPLLHGESSSLLDFLPMILGKD